MKINQFQAEKIIHDAGDRFSMIIERWVGVGERMGGEMKLMPKWWKQKARGSESVSV